jgi:pre-rRNA-processing protein TSR2
VETVLLQVMVDEFEVNVDDDSALEVAQQIVRARAQCAAGQFDETNALAERFAKLKGGKVGQMFRKAEDPNQDTDDEPDDSENDDDEGSDEDMGDAPALAPKEKQEPQVDQDGFTMVTKKKR